MKRLIINCLVMMIMATSVEAQTNNGKQEKKDAIQLSRYTQLRNIPPVDQMNPLRVVVKTKIPQNIKTIGNTVKFLLIRSGYKLADESVLSHETKALLSLSLPQIHRKLGPMTLDTLLSTLAGESFSLLVDPVHRKIGYELTSNLERI